MMDEGLPRQLRRWEKPIGPRPTGRLFVEMTCDGFADMTFIDHSRKMFYDVVKVDQPDIVVPAGPFLIWRSDEKAAFVPAADGCAAAPPLANIEGDEVSGGGQEVQEL